METNYCDLSIYVSCSIKNIITYSTSSCDTWSQSLSISNNNTGEPTFYQFCMFHFIIFNLQYTSCTAKYFFMRSNVPYYLFPLPRILIHDSAITPCKDECFIIISEGHLITSFRDDREWFDHNISPIVSTATTSHC